MSADENISTEDYFDWKSEFNTKGKDKLMFIKVKHVDVESVQKGKNSYQVAEVSYDTEQYKNQVHKVMSFVNPTVFAVVSKAQKGDTFEVDKSKNSAGFNQWNSITPTDSAGGVNDSVASSSAPTRSASTPSTQVNRSFETAEERADRQRLIVRQSSLTAALATLSPGSKGPIDPEAVKALAEQYTDWVFEKVDLFDQPNDIDNE